MKKDFKIHSIDNDYYQINYSAVILGQKIYYCLKAVDAKYGGVTCYRSTKDLEPNYALACNRGRFEIPTGNSAIEIIVRKYLTIGVLS